MAINLSFWGWASNRTREIVGVVIASCVSAVIAFCTTCVLIGFFTIPPIHHIPPSMPLSLPSAWQIYLFASAWWSGGIVACVVANYVLIRCRRRAYREIHWSERPVDGR